MSSWKKAAKSCQREHRERHQPESRNNFGLLEKKKDYKIRVKAFTDKKNQLKKLRKKVLNKNPNEFYFHMINSEVKDGLHYEKEKPDESTETQMKLMQTQDLKYISFKRSTEAKKIEKLKSSLHLLNTEDKPQNCHTFFVDSKSEMKKFDVASHLQTHPSMLERSYNRPRIETLQKLQLKGTVHEDCIHDIKKQVHQQYRELSKRIEREQELSIVGQKLDVKRKLMNKKEQPLRKVKEGTKTAPPVYVWRKERKR